jgi:hypothetical protein
MIGTTLTELRDRIESLASDAGNYYLVCARTGDRPVPAEHLYFDGRRTARTAARATEQYRETLRRYDPQMPYYDVIVCEDHGTELPDRASPLRAEQSWTLSEPVLDDAGPPAERRTLVEFCHRVAAAVFETLSKAGYDEVETAVMDTYFALAERTGDPNELCLGLLEGMATELATRLDPTEQADILARAGARLPSTGSAEEPVAATFAWLRRCGLLEEYIQSPPTVHADGTRSIVVRLSGYALSPQDGHLPVLPVVLDLYRRDLVGEPSDLLVETVDEGWRLTVQFATVAKPGALVSAPIHEAGS